MIRWQYHHTGIMKAGKDMKRCILLLMLVMTACSGGEETLNPINDELRVAAYERFSENLQNNNGMTKERAEKEAFDYLVQRVAVVNRAQEVGIEVTEEEAMEMSNNVREKLENGKIDNAESTLKDIRNTMEAENLTETKYWEEYAKNGYKETLMIDKLKTYEEENALKPWSVRKKEIVKAFKSNESGRIESFREKVGLP
ncbi:hypothetical protein [Salibacterium halotolerans]|nr:hypothetical protein [Salibacterium halotolerans]